MYGPTETPDALQHAWADAMDCFAAKRDRAESTFRGEQCGNCSRRHFVSDDVHAERICLHCGWVDERFRLVDTVDDELVRPRVSAPYNPVYHFNEVYSAYQCTGPAVPHVVLENLRAFVANTPLSVWDPDTQRAHGRPLMECLEPIQLTRRQIRIICNRLGLRKYSERWVQIKKKLAPDWKILYPSPDQEYQLRTDFAIISRCFERELYRGGQRYTWRDNMWASKDPLARHNRPHYSWLIQMLLYRIGGQELLDKIHADTFFPLQRTASVRRKLRFMWVRMCEILKWDVKLI